MIIVYHRHDKTPLGGRAKQFLPQNRRKIASEFEQVRNSGDFSAINRHEIAMKSQVVYTCDLKSHQTSPLKSHQNRTKIASKIACVNGPLPSWTQVGNKLTCRNSEDAFVRPFSRQIGLVHGLDPNAVRSGRKQLRQVHLDDFCWRHSPAEQLRGGRVGRAHREFDVIFRPRSAVSCREQQHCFPWLDFSNTQMHWRYRETRTFTMSHITLSISVLCWSQSSTSSDLLGYWVCAVSNSMTTASQPF